MIAFTVSPPGAVLYSTIGHFISAEQDHLLFVKPHSVEYYGVSEFDDPPTPEIDIPLTATIIGGFKFSLPNSPYDNLILLTDDLTPIVFTHSDSQEGEIPFERRVFPNLRNQHVIPTDFFPLFASVANHLFISIYPNSLALITFAGQSLEKNEIHFTRLLPRFLRTCGSKLLIIDDPSDRPLKTLDISRLPPLLETPTADSSDALETLDVAFSADHFLVRNDLFYAVLDGKILRFDFGRELEPVVLPNQGFVSATDLTTIAFDDGELLSFDPESLDVAHIGNRSDIVNVVDLKNGNLVLFAESEAPVVYEKESQSVVATFSQYYTDLSDAIVVPHSITGTDALLVAHSKDLSLIGNAQAFEVESIVEVPDGERLFSAGPYLIVAKGDSSLLMENQEVVELPGFVSDDSTILFTPSGTVAKLSTATQHASSRGSRFAIAPQGSPIQCIVDHRNQR
jgi:hypothetical protein